MIVFLNLGFLEDPSDFLLFLGRLHPVVVHLPIGFLVLAVIAQFAVRKPKFEPLTPFIPYAWGLGALSAFFAVVFGYFLSLSGDYDPNTLSWHKWMGVIVLVLAVACFYTTKKNTRPLFFSKWVFTSIIAVATLITGHLGGNLTHGSTYLLEYAPNTIRSIAGLDPKAEPRKKVVELDSADVFLDMVLPMMQNKCTSCHNSEKKKGGLRLDSYESIMKGGESGEIIIAADANSSEFFRRITLPDNHEDFMPSEGKRPLTDDEITLLEWWINTGAHPNGYLTQLNPSKKIALLAKKFFGLDNENQFYSQKIPPPNNKVIDTLLKHGVVINKLMRGNNFLDINLSLLETPLQTKDLDLLVQLKQQVVWLNVNNTNLTDDQLKTIGQLENLTHLDLSRNAITDTGIVHLFGLNNLESLNLYNTKVSKEITTLVNKLKQLKTIYLWQTLVPEEGISNLKSKFPKLQIIDKRE